MKDISWPEILGSGYSASFLRFDLALRNDAFEWWINVVHPFLNFFAAAQRELPYAVHIPDTILNRGPKKEATKFNNVQQSVIYRYDSSNHANDEKQITSIHFSLVLFKKWAVFEKTSAASLDWISNDVASYIFAMSNAMQMAQLPYDRDMPTPVTKGIFDVTLQQFVNVLSINPGDKSTY